MYITLILYCSNQIVGFVQKFKILNQVNQFICIDFKAWSQSLFV